jgi:uncharacterized protein (AIM24 family)
MTVAVSEPALERVSLRKALAGKQLLTYHRMSATGELVAVSAIERYGRHFRLTLASGQRFLVDPDHMLYTTSTAEQMRLP